MKSPSIISDLSRGTISNVIYIVQCLIHKVNFLDELGDFSNLSFLRHPLLKVVNSSDNDSSIGLNRTCLSSKEVVWLQIGNLFA